MTKLVYVNGSLVSQAEAKISVFDYGLLYGYGLFETMRAYGGRLFRLEEHLERLFRGAQIIGIGIPVTKAQITEAMGQVLAANGLKDAYIRISFTYGEGPPGLRLSESESSKPNFIIMVDELPKILTVRREKGIKVLIASTRQNQLSPLTTVKSLNFLNNIMARREAIAKGFDDAILRDGDGFVAEASTSNIFLVSNNQLITPSERCGILLGITRKVVMELAEKLGFDVFEKETPIAELMAAEECFLTNSIVELTPVVQINEKSIGDGNPGKITKVLHAAYKKLVDEEIGSGN